MDSYLEDFIIIPISYADSDLEYNRIKNIVTISRNALLSAFEDHYDSLEDATLNCKTFEDIEKKLKQAALSTFMFNSFEDNEKNLRQRVEQYVDTNMDYDKLIAQKTESEIFLNLAFQYIMQCFDILILSSYYNIYPFIRNEVVFGYFVGFAPSYLDIIDTDIINKTVIAYVLQSHYQFETDDYKTFIERFGNNQLVDHVYSILKDENKMFPNNEAKEVIKIADEYIYK